MQGERAFHRVRRLLGFQTRPRGPDLDDVLARRRSLTPRRQRPRGCGLQQDPRFRRRHRHHQDPRHHQTSFAATGPSKGKK